MPTKIPPGTFSHLQDYFPSGAAATTDMAEAATVIAAALPFFLEWYRNGTVLSDSKNGGSTHSKEIGGSPSWQKIFSAFGFPDDGGGATTRDQVPLMFLAFANYHLLLPSRWAKDFYTYFVHGNEFLSVSRLHERCSEEACPLDLGISCLDPAMLLSRQEFLDAKRTQWLGLPAATGDELAAAVSSDVSGEEMDAEPIQGQEPALDQAVAEAGDPKKAGKKKRKKEPKGRATKKANTSSATKSG